MGERILDVNLIETYEQAVARSQLNDAARILDDVNKIRGALREMALYGHMITSSAYGKKLVHMNCWDRDEATKIDSFLTDEERDRVVFTFQGGRLLNNTALDVLQKIQREEAANPPARS